MIWSNSIFVQLSLILGILVVLVHSEVIDQTVDVEAIQKRDVVIVKSPVGRFQGHIERANSFRANDYITFYGIPYAKPPIEELRFEPPQQLPPLPELFVADTSTECLQIGYSNNENPPGQGTEDCLHLNIHIPGSAINIVPNTPPKKKKPVLVNIHGGAFSFGKGHGTSPKYFMDQNIILVTMNYRLGIFGFLSSEDTAIPGNNGLKDQQLALQWIQKNIEHFGGDPSSITLHGHSAGGASVHLHMLSTMSKGLFHRAMSLSGVALNPWVIQDRAREKFLKLGKHLQCTESNAKSKDPEEISKGIKSCLKKKDSDDILKATNTFRSWYFNPLMVFGPVVDEWAKEDAFLPKHPYKMLQDQKVVLSDVPWIVSITETEGIYPGFALIQNDFELFEELDGKWDEVLGAVLDHQDVTQPKATKMINKAIRMKYFGGEHFLEDKEGLKKYKYTKFEHEDIKTMIKLLGDRLYLADFDTAIRLQSLKSNMWVLNYNYTAEKVPSLLLGDDKKYGVGHGDDFMLIFDPHNSERKGNDLKMMDFFLKFYTNFIKTGNPKVDNWMPMNQPDSVKFLDIQSPNEIKMKSVAEFGSASFWGRLMFYENAFFEMSKRHEKYLKIAEQVEKEAKEEMEKMAKERTSQKSRIVEVKKEEVGEEKLQRRSKHVDEF